MANKRSWDIEHRRKRLDYLFRAYVLYQEPVWHSRHTLLTRLAETCGDHYHWAETIHVGERLEMQQWFICGFKEHEHKLKFEAGVPAIMAIEMKQDEGVPLPNGLANPDRDWSALAQRMAKKPYRAQWR